MGETSRPRLLPRGSIGSCPRPPRLWLGEQLGKLGGEVRDRDLYLALGLVPSKLGKADLDLSAADLEAAAQARAGWDPRGWSIDQAARILILLHAGGTGAVFAQRFTQLCRTADVAEAIAFYRGLPLYPDPSGSRPRRRRARAPTCGRCSKRSRTAPLSQGAVRREPLESHGAEGAVRRQHTAPDPGLDERANPTLARMLCDYAHERWAAGRPVSPELWRCVGPHADAEALGDLQRVLATGGAIERKAAALALAACPDPRAQRAARHGARPGGGGRARRTYLGASGPGALSRPSANSLGPGRPAWPSGATAGRPTVTGPPGCCALGAAQCVRTGPPPPLRAEPSWPSPGARRPRSRR